MLICDRKLFCSQAPPATFFSPFFSIFQVMGRFGPIPVRTLVHFGSIPIRTLGPFGPIPSWSGHFGLGCFGPISEVGRFGPILVGRFGPL